MFKGRLAAVRMVLFLVGSPSFGPVIGFLWAFPGGLPQPSSILIGFSIINQLFGVSPWKSSMVGVLLTSELEVPKGFWSKTSDGSPPLRASGCRTGSPYRLALFGHWRLGCGRFGISFYLFWWTVLQHVDIFELNTLKHSWTLNRLRNDLEHETSEFNHQRQRFSRWTRRCIWGSAATCTSWGAESRGWASSQRRWLLWPLDMHRSGICWWLFVYTPYVCWMLLMFAWLVYLYLLSWYLPTAHDPDISRSAIGVSLVEETVQICGFSCFFLNGHGHGFFTADGTW